MREPVNALQPLKSENDRRDADIAHVNIAAHHPLTLTTFLFPLPMPAPGPGDPAAPAPAAPPSVAFMPAFTASINIPLGSAGEYGDTRLVSGGWGVGGMGKRRPPCFLGGLGVGAFDFDLADLGGFGADVGLGEAIVYGDLGMSAGLRRWIRSAIASKSCFSVRHHRSAHPHEFQQYHSIMDTRWI